MSHVTMKVVQKTSDKLEVQPQRGVAKRDEEPTLRWEPAGKLKIQFIGFADPVGGPSDDIGRPTPASDHSGAWTAPDKNTVPAIYSYTVYAELEDGRIISSDPEIENEGKSGMRGEDGRGRGGGGGGGRGQGRA